MSWLGRLLGRPEPSPGGEGATVALPPELASGLRARGLEPQATTLRLLHTYLEQLDTPPPADANQPQLPLDGAEVPFWLARDGDGAEGDTDLEDRLRDRVAQRRAAEAEH